MNEGYSRTLGNRQVRMIAVSLTIGVGLFLGTGGRLQAAGPGLLLSYLLAGIAAFFVMRAVGELVTYRQTSGGFVSYARELIGPRAAFAVGWTSWFGSAMATIAQITAIGVYVKLWFPQVPQWITALAVLVVLLALNLLAVRLFAEVQYWFSLIKVLAIAAFLVAGVAALFVAPPQHSTTELFPNGFAVVLLSMQAAVFAYAGVESVAVAAGESREPGTLKKAVNGVIWQIGVFYLGSLTLLIMLLPWTAYGPGESPFVTVFTHLGVPLAGDVMNVVVLTAALSACNSGVYAGARVTRDMALGGDAPALATRMSARNVPVGATVLAGGVWAVGVLINYLVPAEAFAIAVSMAAFGLMTVWATLIVCQLRLRAKVNRGEAEQPAFRMPGAPYSGWFVLGLLSLVLVMMLFGSPATALCIPVITLTIAIGWTRRRVTHDQRIP